jgi:putative PIN family toxin of toxin-antitoxin system
MGVVAATLVLDTNIVLDLLVFEDPAAVPLRAALDAGSVVWLATRAMREELERVLAYARITPWLAARGRTRDEVLAQFDRLSRDVGAAAPSAIRCRDSDDQIFIDLAASHRAALLSKDAQVLRLRRRLATLGVEVSTPGAQVSARAGGGPGG